MPARIPSSGHATARPGAFTARSGIGIGQAPNVIFSLFRDNTQVQPLYISIKFLNVYRLEFGRSPLITNSSRYHDHQYTCLPRRRLCRSWLNPAPPPVPQLADSRAAVCAAVG